jgi:UDP-N-acetylglucosamine 2-epimerase (non-hydrolysing)
MNIELENSVRIVTRRVGAAPGPASLAAASGTVLHVVGSRSDAVRLAPVVSALTGHRVPQAVARLVGGDGDVFDTTGLPRTNSLLDDGMTRPVGELTAHALAAVERVLMDDPPRALMIAGEGDAMLACALAASKLGIPIIRLQGGLRSGDFSLGEEINRVLIDRVAALHFTDGVDAADTLQMEGFPTDRLFQAGNTAVDGLRRWERDARTTAIWRRFGLPVGGYVVVTLHRPENVDDDERLARATESMAELARRIPVIFPIHPRTRALMEPMGDLQRLRAAGVQVIPPLGYVDFLSLQMGAGAILTDSGVVQEEATILGVRCYTLRRSTERLLTLTHGTNILLGDYPEAIATVSITDPPPHPAAIPLWDGRAADRLVTTLMRRMAELPRAA